MTLTQLEALVAGRTDNGNNPVATERDLWRAVINEAIKLYEVKEIDVNITANPGYMAANFDNTGLGINSMVGFAICNGNNGTKNRNGLTAIGYGPSYPTIGQTGGSADAVLVAHQHNIRYNANNAGGGGGQRCLDNTGVSPSYNTTEIAGESGIGKNMQPFIVTLM